VAMSRSSVGNTVERIRRQLDAAQRLEINQLGVAADNSSTTITLAHHLQTSIRPGAILSVGRELLRVMGVAPATKEVTVIRGWQAAGAEAPDNGVEVLISPRFTRFDIYDAMVAEIESWNPKLFRVVSYEWAVADTTTMVEVPVEYAD